MLSNMNQQPPPPFAANALPSINEMDVQSVLTHPDIFNTNVYQQMQGQYGNIFQTPQPPLPQQQQPFMMRQQPASPTSAEYYNNMYWNHQQQ